MKRLLAGILLAVPSFAIDGFVMNVTTGQPQAGVAIDLVQPSQNGMVPLGNTTSGLPGRSRL